MKKVIRVSQISVPLAHTKEEIFQKACALAQIPMKKVQSMQIMKQSVDARKKDALSYTYTVQLVVDEHQKIRKNHAHVQELKPVVYQIPERKELLSEKREQMAVIGAGQLICWLNVVTVRISMSEAEQWKNDSRMWKISGTGVHWIRSQMCSLEKVVPVPFQMES